MRKDIIVPVLVVWCFTLLLAWAVGGAHGQSNALAFICTEINWESPTCKEEKEWRLKP